MKYSKEIENMCKVRCGASHGCAPIPEEGKWVYSKEIKDISGLTHGIGWCAPQQGACKLTLNIKEGIIEEALIETLGCSGMTHSAAMASEALVGKTLLEALNTDLVCDAINTAMRELFLQIVYGRSQSAFSEDGLPIGAGLEDLGKGTRSQVGTVYSTKIKGPRYLELAEGYIMQLALDENDEIIGYEYVNMGKFMDAIKAGVEPLEALDKAKGRYGRYAEGVKYIDPRKEQDNNMALFESYERRIDKINQVLNSYGISSIEEAKKIVDDLGVDVYGIVKGIQPICFENACWAYIVGSAIAVKKGDKTAYEVAKSLGEGLQSFCIPGSVADDRKVGLGHGNLAAM